MRFQEEKNIRGKRNTGGTARTPERLIHHIAQTLRGILHTLRRVRRRVVGRQCHLSRVAGAAAGRIAGGGPEGDGVFEGGQGAGEVERDEGLVFAGVYLCAFSC